MFLWSDIFTVELLAQALRIGKNAAYALVRSKQIASIRIGRKYCIPKIYVLDYVQSSRRKGKHPEEGCSKGEESA